MLLASLLFYIWGSGALVLLLGVSVAADYVLGIWAARAHRLDDSTLKRAVIGTSVAINLTLLGCFKYAGWLIGVAADAGLWTGTAPNIVLPIGISFFTFQSMSYTIDVARGRCNHLANPIDFALFVTLFPQLIAGPIVRYHEIEQEIRERPFSLSQVGDGALRFSHGLAKKVIIADSVAPIADAAFLAAEVQPGGLSTLAAWLGAVAYTIQIYFDFSGYSDMAIGLGIMFGFTIPENFRRPYSAVSVTDFWRRWHITLSNWFRDYLYIPMGGGRGSNVMVYRNLMTVFVLTGIWHGANWTFVLWGLYHGAWLLIERVFGWRATEVAETSRRIGRRAATLLIVMVGWVLFRAPDVTTAFEFYRAMVPLDGLGSTLAFTGLAMREKVVFVAACAVFVLPASLVVGASLRRPETRWTMTRSAVMVVGLPMSLLLVAAGALSPFLYFQF